MENATKALIIAAAILIAIVLISLGVFVLGQGTNLVQENSDLTPTEVMMFNSKFEAYFGKNVSGTKVKQLIKFVNQYNKTAEKDRHVDLKDDKNQDLTEASEASASKSYNVEGNGDQTGSGLITKITVTEAGSSSGTQQ